VPRAAATAVAVKVSQVKNSDGSVRYSYRVVNHASTPVVAAIVGRDYYRGTSDVVTPPTGWTFESGLPASSVVSPAGWRAAVITTEESRNIEIEWRNDGQTYDIGNGQTKVFRVLVPRADDKYRSAHWTVIFGDSTVASVTLSSPNEPKPKRKLQKLLYILRTARLVHARRPGTGTQRAEEWPCLFPVVEPPSAACCGFWVAPWPCVSAPDAVAVAAAAEAPRCRLQPRSLSLPPAPPFPSERVGLSPLLRPERRAFG
jgi:hypothetical protein